jgi:hypothetical protein
MITSSSVSRSLQRSLFAFALFCASCASGGAEDASGGAEDASIRPDARALDAAIVADAGAPPDAADAGFVEDASEQDAGVTMRAVERYLALGSSSTFGSGASSPELAYVERITTRLRESEPDLMLLNLGAGGATVGSFLRRRSEIEAFDPILVTILPFTDYVQTSTTTFRRSYGELLDLLGGLGATVMFGDLRIDPMLVCGVGSGPGGCYGTEDRDLLAAKNAILTDLASTRSFVVVVPVLDQNAAHPEWNAPDGHPNDLGHEYLAETFLEAIGAWLTR